MNFELFTHIALGALSRTYSHKCSFLPVGEVTTGPSIIRFLSRPIRRDLFPNNFSFSTFLFVHHFILCKISFSFHVVTKFRACVLLERDHGGLRLGSKKGWGRPEVCLSKKTTYRARARCPFCGADGFR